MLKDKVCSRSELPSGFMGINPCGELREIGRKPELPSGLSIMVHFLPREERRGKV